MVGIGFARGAESTAKVRVIAKSRESRVLNPFF